MRDSEAEEATLEQLKRSYDVRVSEALQGKLDEQNRADEAQIEEMERKKKLEASQLDALKEAHATREQDLLKKLERVKGQLDRQSHVLSMRTSVLLRRYLWLCLPGNLPSVLHGGRAENQAFRAAEQH